jgi:hypothetical protein
MALATRAMEGTGATFEVLYPGYHGLLINAHKSGYDRLPLVANGWRTKHPVPDMAPPLLAEEEWLPT